MMTLSGLLKRIRYLPLALALLAPSVAAAAQPGVEVSVGRSFTLRHKWTDVAFLEWTGTPRPLSGWLRWAPAATIGRVAGRDDLPGHHLRRTVWIGAAGARAYFWHAAFLGFQVAATEGRTDALSTPCEFVSSLGWQGRHVVWMVRHMSNGDLHVPNDGETMLLLGFRF